MKKNHESKPRAVVKTKLIRDSNRIPKPSSEKNVDAVPLDHELERDLRDTTDMETENIQPDTSVNSSQPEDRGEDLINETDPFIQQPEKDTDIPAELIQHRAYHLYEQRGRGHGYNVDDWLEAERQLRREQNEKL